MVMASNSHIPFTSLHLLLLIFIYGTQACPPSIYFECPDHVYTGEMLKYPFTNYTLPDCGYCILKCDKNVTMIACGEEPKKPSLRVLNISAADQTMVLHTPNDNEWRNSPCKAHKFFRLKSSPWVSLKMRFKTYIKCPDPQYPPSSGQGYGYNCEVQENKTVYGPYGHPDPPQISIPKDCEVVQFPSIPSNTNNFTVRYAFSRLCQQCVQAGGRCFDDQKICYGLSNNRNNGKKRLAIILSSGCVLIILALVIIYWRKTKSKPSSSTLASGIISFHRTKSDLEGGTVNGGVTVFYYKELEEATNNFDPTGELGEGGFGIVYHGKLRDGREVAVKRLYEKNYKRIEQFTNEIKILTGLRHKNLVTLYGCTSRHSRELLLVYEYIPNGTVADHLHGDHPKSQFITWSTRMNIAIETAEALSYLHHEDIIHRDVKTNNILLDNNFSVKVADFGLSRLFPADVTHVSTAPQGTPGYLDPEYHQCYHLTDRSDVYSFGVVLIELISSLPAVDVGRHRHEINLSNYAIIKIQGRAFNELVDPKLGFETDSKVRKMTTLVAELAFRCLQHERELRPSMDEILDALKRIISLDYDALEAEEMEMRVESNEFMKTLPSSTDDIGFLKNVQRQSSLPKPMREKWLSQSMKRPPSLKGDGSLRFLRISQAQPKPNSSIEKDDVGLLKNAQPLPTSPASVIDNWSSQSSVMDNWSSQSSTPNASS